MKVMWKHPLTLGFNLVSGPKGWPRYFNYDAEGVLCVWIEHTGGVAHTRTFYVHGTGHQVMDTHLYVGSVVAQNGFVWHLFEDDPNGEMWA